MMLPFVKQEDCVSVRHFSECYRTWQTHGDGTDYLSTWMEHVLNLPRECDPAPDLAREIEEAERKHQTGFEDIQRELTLDLEHIDVHHRVRNAHWHIEDSTPFNMALAKKHAIERARNRTENHAKRGIVESEIAKLKEDYDWSMRSYNRSVKQRAAEKQRFIDWLLQVFRVRFAVRSAPVPAPMIIQCEVKGKAKEFLEHLSGERLKSIWVRSWDNWSYVSQHCFVDVLNPNALIVAVATSPHQYHRERSLCSLNRDMTALERLSKQQDIRGTTPVVVLDSACADRCEYPHFTLNGDAQYDAVQTAMAIGQALSMLKQ